MGVTSTGDAHPTPQRDTNPHPVAALSTLLYTTIRDKATRRVEVTHADKV